MEGKVIKSKSGYILVGGNKSSSLEQSEIQQIIQKINIENDPEVNKSDSLTLKN